jgi:hypothetical protein
LDCVVSYHMNPATCGVAKFNAVLSQQLGIPMLNVFDDAVLSYSAPLLSVKVSEFTPDGLQRLDQRLRAMLPRQQVAVFFHTFTHTPIERLLLDDAAAIYCGNKEIHEDVQALRRDALELWCPGTITATDRFERTELTVFTFGMAHKIRLSYYLRLKALLEATGKSYALYLSTALHENTTFEESFDGVFDAMRSVFGDRAYFVGFLSDAAVYNYLWDCTYFAAFFENGVRSNNTSVNSALACGATVITNLDPLSPPVLQHDHNILDIGRLETLPTDNDTLAAIGARAREAAQREFSWDSLIAALRVAGPEGLGVPNADRLGQRVTAL